MARTPVRMVLAAMLAIVPASVARADRVVPTRFEIEDVQIEGELPEPELVPAVPPELAVSRSMATIEERSAMFAAALRTTKHPRARANLVLATADLWAAYALDLRHQAFLLEIGDPTAHRIRAEEIEREIAAVQQGRPVPRPHAVGLKDALSRAIEAYGTLYDDPALRDWPNIDGALARYARVLAAADHAWDAANVYERLLRDHPRSPHRWHALVAIADNDRVLMRVDEALAGYRAVANAPTAPAAERAYAMYRVAAMQVDAADPDQAFASFARAIALDPRGILSREAQRGLVSTFASYGTADHAYAEFARVAPDHAIELVDALAVRYAQNGQRDAAIAVNRELLRRLPNDPRMCTWQERIVRATDDPFDVQARLVETERMVAVLDRARALALATTSQCEDAVTTFTIGDAAHLEREARLSRRRDLAHVVDRLYELFLRALPDHAGVSAAQRARAALRAQFP